MNLDYKEKEIKKDKIAIADAEAYLNIELENLRTPNNIKEYEKIKHGLILHDKDLDMLKLLYERIYEDNEHNKNNSFILALCILLISNILDINTICLLNNLGID